MAYIKINYNNIEKEGKLELFSSEKRLYFYEYFHIHLHKNQFLTSANKINNKIIKETDDSIISLSLKDLDQVNNKLFSKKTKNSFLEKIEPFILTETISIENSFTLDIKNLARVELLKFNLLLYDKILTFNLKRVLELEKALIELKKQKEITDKKNKDSYSLLLGDF